jgi:glycosyltransferase involved in cell wall biosynthesis
MGAPAQFEHPVAADGSTAEHERRHPEPIMHLFLNFLAASAGGGLTYIRNVIPEMAARSDLKVTAALTPGLRDEFHAFPQVRFEEVRASGLRRLWHEQFILSQTIRRSGANILISTGNLALRNSPVPQILLSRNSLYNSADFYRDLIARREYRIWLETRATGWLARRSITWADVTVAPSEAFAAELRRWTGASRILASHHGFDREAFTRDATPLNPSLQERLRSSEGTLKLLFVSHYNYYRNFETLIRALPLLRDRLPGRRVHLLLTCKLEASANPGPYRAEAAAQLIGDLGVSDMVVELGSVPYRQLHHLYDLADLYVTPAYAETFAHPLVEAMSSGLPIVASGLAVHREICGDAAVYFPRLSSDALANCIADVATNSALAEKLSQAGKIRSADFSWKKHVDRLLQLADSLVAARTITSREALAADQIS